MDGKRLIEKIKLRNILSFGDKGEEIELQPLNVLIGQNGSGKSNFIDIFKLLRSLPENKGLVNFISKNGGIVEWIWKGKGVGDFAEIEVFVPISKGFRFKIIFAEDSQRLRILEELVEDDISKNNFEYQLNDESILARKEKSYEFDLRWSLTLLSNLYGQLSIFTDLVTTRKAEIRKDQLTDAINDFLEEDGSNLALVLNDLEHRGNTKDKIVEYLKKFNPRVKDYSIRISGGTVRLFIREEGLEKPISAMRLSDGTLRYLCLLTILLHPEPPPLICIEEPEVGLHPDILPTIGELLIDASKRTQLIVTTHSDILISALSEVPEAVLVCESDEDGTHLKRLEKDKLKLWLEEYSLGEVWLRGAIGGTRW